VEQQAEHQQKEICMKKPMMWMLIGVIILFGAIFGFKKFVTAAQGRYMKAHSAPIVYVSATKVAYSPWQPQLNATGSIRAITGVNVTTELAGMVRTIAFTPGATVNKGDLLAQLDIAPEVAQLHVYEANAELAKITYERDKAQYAVKAVSKQQLDSDNANLKSTEAQVAQENAIIEQKTIRAPFNGRVGICQINPGQYLKPGDTVTMLQTLDPIYVDFYIPQQSLFELKTGQDTSVVIDTLPGKIFTGKITTINPGVDTNVRNVEVEATLPNPDFLLTPGMFAAVTINIQQPIKYLTLPISAVSFNPYGEVIYIIKQTGTDKDGKPILIAKERFITTGEKRGDQITILSGLEEGDWIVTSGQLKLKNGSRVIVNNTVAPTNDPAPQPVDV
jgi:membrane fusion protein (multidrug efflux system)